MQGTDAAATRVDMASPQVFEEGNHGVRVDRCTTIVVRHDTRIRGCSAMLFWPFTAFVWPHGHFFGPSAGAGREDGRRP